LPLFVAAALAGSLQFDSYWSLDEIYDYMDELQATYPGFAEVESMGQSEEGRIIRGLRITNEEHLGQEALPVIFVTAGKHARNWITMMSAVNLMHELLDHYEDNRAIVDNIEWFIIPVSNPDGYEFSRTPGNRDWVKNRRVNPGSDCLGVHIQRNFDFNWGLGLSTSDDPCADDYRGPAGDSEEETKTIQFATDIFRRLQQAAVSISGGTVQPMITFPLSSNNEIFRGNFRDQIGVANLMTEAIWSSTGRRYTVSSDNAAVGFVSGTINDYSLAVDNIPFFYTIRTGNGPVTPWVFPEDQINRIADEVFAGIVALANYIADLPLPGQSQID